MFDHHFDLMIGSAFGRGPVAAGHPSRRRFSFAMKTALVMKKRSGSIMDVATAMPDSLAEHSRVRSTSQINESEKNAGRTIRLVTHPILEASIDVTHDAHGKGFNMRKRTTTILAGLLSLLVGSIASHSVAYQRVASAANDNDTGSAANDNESFPNKEGPAAAKGDIIIDGEWFADIPWHQKLSSNDSNLIDIPFILPYAAIPQNLDGCKGASTETEKSRCMLEHGIVNVLAFHRTDRLYQPGDRVPEGQSCTDGQCVQVKIDIQRLNTQTNDSCQAWAEPVVESNVPCQPDIVTNDGIGGPAPRPVSASYGFAISEATVFAPWRPWYMGHYCGYGVTSVSDSVCYESYFTSQLQAYTPKQLLWPNDRAALFFPSQNYTSEKAPVVGDYCLTGEDKCTMYLAKVDWTKGAQGPKVTGCDKLLGKEICDAWPTQDLQIEINEKTARLDENFNAALGLFKDVGRFPWGNSNIPTIGSKGATIPKAPYLGYYDLVLSEQRPSDWKAKNAHNRFQAAHYVFPKQCIEDDFVGARHGDLASIDKLKECAVNYELHYSGFFEQWDSLFKPDADKDDVFDIMRDLLTGLPANQYGRTMFLMAGLPEQKIAVPFLFDEQERGNTAEGRNNTESLSLYDKVYGSSIYTQYLPMVNPADNSAQVLQSYGNNMWHSFFMSNHMNQSPEHFIRGIRGRTLWHNEWRSNLMFLAYYNKYPGSQSTFTQVADTNAAKLLRAGVTFDKEFDHRDFPAGFQPQNHQVPFHGNTCDSCHIRNGSGIPVAPNGYLSNIHTDRGLNLQFNIKPDYTYTNGYNPRLNDPKGKGNTPAIPSMKMVLFDIGEPTRLSTCDSDDHTTPASVAFPESYYTNAIMNFYGNTFHVNLQDGLPTYNLEYVEIGGTLDVADGKPYEIVDKTERRRLYPDGGYTTYEPKLAVVSGFRTEDSSKPGGYSRCQDGDINAFAPTSKAQADDLGSRWPTDCNDVSGVAVEEAIKSGRVGYMHLLGKRLGNTPLIEMLPDAFVLDASEAQKEAFKFEEQKWYANGCVDVAPGTRAGTSIDELNYRRCKSGKLGESTDDCYLGRWGWIGDRASLEDQVANAALVEQNITTKESFDLIAATDRTPLSNSEYVRYNTPLCGPADLGCQLVSSANSDITEQEVRDMATYQRWIGIPQRSQFQVETEAVKKGEQVFRETGCHHCHIIDKVPFVEADNMLPDEERAKLKRLLLQHEGKTDYPFVSYLGTDLLLHDMGYLSQVAKGKTEMRDPVTGKIEPKYLSYFQFIRTPPLKGLRFNRFVTDSHHHSTDSLQNQNNPPQTFEAKAGCDFLLHDGRACDAIEAAFLHDGPAVKSIDMIRKLSELNLSEIENLRAFLYSL